MQTNYIKYINTRGTYNLYRMRINHESNLAFTMVCRTYKLLAKADRKGSKKAEKDRGELEAKVHFIVKVTYYRHF